MSDLCRGRLAPLVCAALLAPLLAAMPARAQPSPQAPSSPAAREQIQLVTRDGDGRVVVRATRITRPVRIDGRLDDEIYDEVPSFEDLVQQEPKNGAPVSERTEMWLMFDDKNIYLACRCWDRHPEGIVANDMRRDGQRQTQHDNVTVTFDTFHDRRNGFSFQTNPIGALRDQAITNGSQNDNWNTVWDVKTARFDKGFTVEMVIDRRAHV